MTNEQSHTRLRGLPIMNAKLLVLVLLAVLVVDHVTNAKPWWGRRRRRSCHNPRTAGYGIVWANNYDRSVDFACPYGKSVNHIRSLYSTCTKDRVWWYGCMTNPATRGGRCHWSNYVNGWDQPINYHCPYSGFITGVASYHQDKFEDRRFRFKCCRHHNYKRYHCTTSRYINGWRATINYKVPYGYHISGLTSHHDNGQEDRRWKIEYCKVKYQHSRKSNKNGEKKKNQKNKTKV